MRELASHGPNLFLYSSEEMNALTISASMKLPRNWSSFLGSKLLPPREGVLCLKLAAEHCSGNMVG
jgi:hypothetical protein